MMAHQPNISCRSTFVNYKRIRCHEPCQLLINGSPPLPNFVNFFQLLQMCFESGGSEPLRGGGRCHPGSSTHYHEIKSKCKRCTIFLRSGGVVNRKIDGDNIADREVPNYRFLIVA